MKLIIKGYEDKVSTQGLIEDCLLRFDNNIIIKEDGIPKPSYDETMVYTKTVNLPFRLYEESIYQDLEMWLGSDLSNLSMISKVITKILIECKENGLQESILNNLYIRLMISLKETFKDIIAKQGCFVYNGTPDRYELVILTVLVNSGVNVVIIDLEGKKELEFLCTNVFELQEGNLKDALDFKKLLVINSTNNVNLWYNYSGCRTYLDYLNSLEDNITSRLSEGVWRTLHLEVVGVHDDMDYSSIVVGVLQKGEAMGRRVSVIENGIPNPSYDESKLFDISYKAEEGKIAEILKEYKVQLGDGIAESLLEYEKFILKTNGFKTETKKSNYLKVLYIWLLRHLDKLYGKGKKLEKLPLVYVWGALNKREEEFIGLLSLLPLDIIHFAPNHCDMYNTITESVYKVKFGESSTRFTNIPKNTGIIKSETVAYKAERELDTILYSGVEGLYRPKQLKDITPIILKTTYDEISILWGQEARYRPSFETVGNMVTVGTIFAKVDGVDGINKDDYINNINELLTNETILYQKLPIVPNDYKTSDFQGFIRQLVYQNNQIDYTRLKKSKYYSYSVYSDETQDLIFRKIEQLIHLDWCNIEVKNLIYLILGVLLNIPNEILQLIHSYDFTSKIPKLLVFSGGEEICSLEDCILLLFLKLVGFDVLVFAPNGYRVIEQYIKPSFFNSINLGNYDFSYEGVDIRGHIGGRKKGFFRNIFGL